MEIHCLKGDFKKMKKFVIGLLVCLFMIVLVACGDDEKKEKEVDEAAGPKLEITDEEKIDDNEIVAIINGDDVKGTTYNLVYSQLKLHAGQFDKDIDVEEIKNATMDSIIDRQLLIQQAKEEGIEITDETANSEFDTLKSENGDALSTLLEQYQLTESGFKEQLKFELTMNEFVEKAIKVSVTDQELEDYYDQAKEGNEAIPEFDEIKEQLKAQLLQQKTEEELQAKIDKVKEKAEIEKKI